MRQEQSSQSDSTLVRVFEIPPPTGEFCFGDGNPVTFIERDWFHAEKQMMADEIEQSDIEEFVKKKAYFDHRKAWLVISPMGCFTINYFATRKLTKDEQFLVNLARLRQHSGY